MTIGVQPIITTVSAWDGIMPMPHRFDGTEFLLGKVEIGHVHHFGLVDIPFTRKLREALVAAGEAKPHYVLPDSGWISFYLRSDADTAAALRLFRLSYLQKAVRRGRMDARTLSGELAALQFSDGINALLLRPAPEDAEETTGA